MLRIRASRLCMCRLRGYRANVPITSSSLLLARSARVDATVAVEADVTIIPYVHSGVVNVVDYVDVHVIDRRVVEEMAAIPAPAFITATEVPEAVIDSAIETYDRAPIANIETKP